jgi:hypothetical protein
MVEAGMMTGQAARAKRRSWFGRLLSLLISTTVAAVAANLMLFTPAAAAGTACTGVVAVGNGKSINTTAGCAQPGVPPPVGGTATNPATGYIQITMPAGVTTATLLDVFQAVGTGDNSTFYMGSYTVSFGSCTGGTATGGTYVVGTGGTYPGTPPTTTGTLPIYTASTAGGTVTCAYTVLYSGTAPTTGHSFRNDVFVTYGDLTTAQFASQSVGAPGGIVVPEAPLAILLPLIGLAIVGVVALAVRRRRILV